MNELMNESIYGCMYVYAMCDMHVQIDLYCLRPLTRIHDFVATNKLKPSSIKVFVEAEVAARHCISRHLELCGMG